MCHSRARLRGMSGCYKAIVSMSPQHPLMALPDLRRLRSNEIDDAADILARAFLDDPLMAFAISDRDHRAVVLPRHLRPGVWLGHHLGQVWCTDDLSAVACWRLPGSGQATADQIRDAGVPELPRLAGADLGARTEPVYEFLSTRTQALAIPPAHWYLSMIGVDPDKRRQGLGSAVIRPVLEIARARYEPMFLETLAAANVAFYSHHGFDTLEEGVEPSSGLAYWLFLRRNDALGERRRM
jgi:ribosomal protein S18 acetylase RimI-like enzyme